MTGRARKEANWFERFSELVTRWAGGTSAFGVAAATILIWGLTGPLFGFSDTWQLVINTGTTIVTFLMVFLIQESQNKDALAIHLKLNELVAAMDGASNRLVASESLSETELRVLSKYYATLAHLAEQDLRISESHSVEEARNRHSAKTGGRKG